MEIFLVSIAVIVTAWISYRVGQKRGFREGKEAENQRIRLLVAKKEARRR